MNSSFLVGKLWLVSFPNSTSRLGGVFVQRSILLRHPFCLINIQCVMKFFAFASRCSSGARDCDYIGLCLLRETFCCLAF